MTEVLDVVNALPGPLKAAWLVWLVWAAGQVAWYRRGRVAVVRQLPAPRPRPRRPVKPLPEPAEMSQHAAAPEPASLDSQVA